MEIALIALFIGLGVAAFYFIKRKGSSTPTTPSAPVENYNLVGSYAGAPVVVQASSGYGAGIFGLLWNGQQLINPEGHGGQLQTAYQADRMGGAWNPTEVGSSADGNNPSHSTTRIISASSDGTTMRSSVNPAFWEPVAGKLVCDDVFSKVVTLGYNGMPNVLHHQMSVITKDAHNNWGVEGLCYYAPFNMNQYWLFDSEMGVAIGSISPTDTIPTPNNVPAILSNADGSLAVALYHKNPTHTYMYGHNVQYPKLDCALFELAHVDAGRVISWEAWTVFGTLEGVRQTLVQIRNTN